MSQISLVRVAAVQFEVHCLKRESEFFSEVERLIEEAAGKGADFVVFPEYFTAPLLTTLPAMSSEDGIERLASEFTPRVSRYLKELAGRHNIWIIGGSQPLGNETEIENVSIVFGPDGSSRDQPKLHVTPSETEAWSIAGGDRIEIIDTPKAKVGVQICYDIEFPEATRLMADHDVDLVFVPYCTEDLHGHLRVNLCARARAIENQIYVVTAGLCGKLESVPNIDFHYAESAVYTPCDLSFVEQGIAAQASPNKSQLIFADLDLEPLRRSRAEGTVTPRTNRRLDLFDTKIGGLKINGG